MKNINVKKILAEADKLAKKNVFSIFTKSDFIFKEIVKKYRDNANANYILRKKAVNSLMNSWENTGLQMRICNLQKAYNEKKANELIDVCVKLWLKNYPTEEDERNDAKKYKSAARLGKIREANLKKYGNLFYECGITADYYCISPSSTAKLEFTCYEDWYFYAKSCKYPKIWRYLNLTLPSGWILENIGGLLTMTNKKNNRVFWLQKNGRALTDWFLVEGWLIDGKHIAKRQGYTASNCVKKEAERLAALKASKKAAKAAVKVAAVDEIAGLTVNYDNITSMYGEEMTKVIKAHADEPVTFTDSLRAGNCQPGTMNFKKRAEALCGAKINTLPLCQVAELGCRFGVALFVGLIIKKKYAI